MSHIIIWEKRISGKERTASAKVLRSELSWCGSREKKQTSVAREENKRTNMGREL